jgi:hypothetical protein
MAAYNTGGELLIPITVLVSPAGAACTMSAGYSTSSNVSKAPFEGSYQSLYM